jgi:hypothetical protein
MGKEALGFLINSFENDLIVLLKSNIDFCNISKNN